MAQFEYLFRDWPVECHAVPDSLNVQIVEDGETAEENAEIKALAYGKVLDELTLGDDAGLEIEALDNKPGLLARRWMGELPDNISDEEWLKFLLDRLEKSPNKSNNARYRASWVIYDPKSKMTYSKEVIIPFIISRNNIYPYKKGNPMSALELDYKTHKPISEMPIESRYKYLKSILESWEEIKSLF